jgi:hypothetical protein
MQDKQNNKQNIRKKKNMQRKQNKTKTKDVTNRV